MRRNSGQQDRDRKEFHYWQMSLEASVDECGGPFDRESQALFATNRDHVAHEIVRVFKTDVDRCFFAVVKMRRGAECSD